MRKIVIDQKLKKLREKDFLAFLKEQQKRWIEANKK